MLRTNLLVSVIIPVYNHERYVEEALNSVLHQTYPNIEVIIIDDGSKDQSIDKIENWLKNNPFSPINFTFIKQENQGAHSTINRGLSLAQGVFLTILNSDDIYDIRRIEKLMNRIQEEQAELAFTAIKGIDENSENLTVGHPWRNSYEHSLHSLGSMPTVGFELLRGNLAISTGNLFFSQQLYQKIGEFKNLKLAHDYDFLMRALLITEPVFLNEELYFYRVHSSNTFSQLIDSSHSELNQIYREYLVAVTNHPPMNIKAPCHWYWPHAFASARSKLKLDNSLAYYYRKEASPSQQPVREKNNIPVYSLRQKRKKISLITHDLSLSGAPTVIVELARSLKEKGYVVKVVSLFEGPLQKELDEQCIPTYVLPRFLAKGLFSKNSKVIKISCLLGSLLLLTKLHRTAIFNTTLPGRLLIPLSILNPFYRLVWYIHEPSSPSVSLGMGRLGQKARNFLNRVLAKPKFSIWFGANSIKNIWSESNLYGKTMYWSGIQASKISIDCSKKEMTEILSIGTSCPRKGTYDLIKAFILGIKENRIKNNVKLTIIGFFEDVNAPHDYVGDLILHVIHSDLKDRINLISCLQPSELEKYYSKCDLYVQSSIAECLPIALLKAMSLGLPIVTTDVNGCTEAIENNTTGYVCCSRNSRILLNTLLEALNNPEKSRKMGLQAQKVFNEKFCLEKNIESVLKIIN